jgi:hypothetical protein
MFKKYTPTQLRVTISDAWVTCDRTTAFILLSDLLPADTVALFLHVVNQSAAEAVGLRKPGSTDDRKPLNPSDCHQWTVVGVDASISFEIWLGNASSQLVYLVGYMTSGSGVMFDNGVAQGGTNWTWVEKDLSGICPNAIGVIFEMVSNGMFWGVRPADSAQDRYGAGYGHEWGIIGCDANQKIDYYKSAAGQTLYIVGYITADAVFLTDAEDISLTVTGSYVDIDLSDKSGVLAFIDVIGLLANQDYALREDGSGENIYRHLQGQHNWGIIGISDAGFIEGKVQSTNVDFYLVGVASKSAKTRSQAIVIG